MSYQDLIDADQRLVILKVLKADDDKRLNDRMIQKAAAYVGHDMETAKVRGHLEFLEVQQLVTLERLPENLWIAQLKDNGLRVAEGRKTVPGVAEPSLG